MNVPLSSRCSTNWTFTFKALARSVASCTAILTTVSLGPAEHQKFVQISWYWDVAVPIFGATRSRGGVVVVDGAIGLGLALGLGVGVIEGSLVVSSITGSVDAPVEVGDAAALLWAGVLGMTKATIAAMPSATTTDVPSAIAAIRRSRDHAELTATSDR